MRKVSNKCQTFGISGEVQIGFVRKWGLEKFDNSLTLRQFSSDLVSLSQLGSRVPKVGRIAT